MKNEGKINNEGAFKRIKASFAYHAPCHAKALQMGRPGVEFLRQVPGISIKEIEQMGEIVGNDYYSTFKQFTIANIMYALEGPIKSIFSHGALK